MEAYRDDFRDKKITVLGLGLLGRGVGDVEFLAQCGAEIVVTDKKSEQELAESVERLKKYPNVTFHLGGHNIEDFQHCDMVLKAAGVRLDSQEIAAARTAHIPVVMSTALFAKYAAKAGAIIVGVTGTRGKSTVVHMIHHCLLRTNRRAVLGGNIRGISTLAMLPDIRKGDIAALELDSWQLQGFGEMRISPHIAVMTNLMPDHQNYYANMDEYFADKANIFKYQSRRQAVGTPSEASGKEGDILIVGHSISEYVRRAAPPVVPVTPVPIPADWKLQVVGDHNRDNAAYAATALKALDVPADEIKAGLESFEGVEGRLQFVREVNGVKIYNDNNSTTPEAAIVALRALDDGPRKSTVLIAGGSDKGLDTGGLVDQIQKRCKSIILLTGTGTDRLKEVFSDAPVYGNLKEAFAAATAAAKKGDSILFSPAFASFGMFKNEYDRNDQFLALARAQ